MNIQSMKIYLATFVLLSVVIFSCKKEPQKPHVEHTYDTIMPHAYFPVYPHSWWKYEVNGSEITTSAVSNVYQLHAYRISENYSWVQPIYSDTVYVPYLDADPIYGYDKIEWVQPPLGDYYRKWPILSETVGFTFERKWEDKRFGDFTEKVEVKNKIFNGIDTVLILEGHWVYGPNVANKSYQEFTKGIGLTCELIIDTVNLDTIYRKKLIDYIVND